MILKSQLPPNRKLLAVQLENPQPNNKPTGKSKSIWLLIPLVAVLAVVARAMMETERVESQKVACITIERRLSTALLLYGQDHDGCLPMGDYSLGSNKWRTWVDLLHSYLAQDEKLFCPLLPMTDVKESTHGYPMPSSYTLNERFFGKFSTGPYPIDNLEIPAQTAMIVEGGPFKSKPAVGAILYGDLYTQPERHNTPHDGKLNVAAADGHVVTLKPPAKIIDHDVLYGRLAGTIFNWNAGYPNGHTAGPPHE